VLTPKDWSGRIPSKCETDISMFILYCKYVRNKSFLTPWHASRILTPVYPSNCNYSPQTVDLSIADASILSTCRQSRTCKRGRGNPAKISVFVKRQLTATKRLGPHRIFPYHMFTKLDRSPEGNGFLGRLVRQSFLGIDKLVQLKRLTDKKKTKNK
jgi:hypothetical protein